MQRAGIYEQVACVTGCVGEGLWRARLSNGHEIMAYASRLIRVRQNEICAGKRVVVQLTPFDLSKGKVIGMAENAVNKA